jgi:hypothetical protein
LFSSALTDGGLMTAAIAIMALALAYAALNRCDNGISFRGPASAAWVFQACGVERRSVGASRDTLLGGDICIRGRHP